ncbi:MAG: succinate dehydrogenase assembly factor 2 [Proteobacteria bacterium]|nr:succinate dehydrogenase assembly factor 2 [Pseudomonadota bacterium]
MKTAVKTQRKRLLFRSWHLGTRELDLVLGPFADTHLAAMSPDQLDRYESLLSSSHPEIFRWIKGEQPVPETVGFDLAELIKNFTNLVLRPGTTR